MGVKRKRAHCRSAKPRSVSYNPRNHRGAPGWTCRVSVSAAHDTLWWQQRQERIGVGLVLVFSEGQWGRSGRCLLNFAVCRAHSQLSLWLVMPVSKREAKKTNEDPSKSSGGSGARVGHTVLLRRI